MDDLGSPVTDPTSVVEPPPAAPQARTREELFRRFVDEAVPHVWGPKGAAFVRPKLELDLQPPAKGILAALAYQGTPAAIGSILYRSAQRYGLRISDELLTKDDDHIWRILVHEAVHVGIANHGRAFRDLCREKGGGVSEFANENQGLIQVQRKEGPRYQTIRDFNDEDEALRWMREENGRSPGRYRITMSRHPVPGQGIELEAARADDDEVAWLSSPTKPASRRSTGGFDGSPPQEMVAESDSWAKTLGTKTVDDVPHRAGSPEFERNEDGSYEGDLPDFDIALKRPEPVEIAEMDESFKVETLEGWVEGDAGDYLVRGPGGEMWPINRDVFEETYVDPASMDEDEKREMVERLEEVLEGEDAHDLDAATTLSAGGPTRIRPRPSWLEGLPDDVAGELWRDDLELDRLIRERKRDPEAAARQRDQAFQHEFELLDALLPKHFEWVGSSWRGQDPDGTVTTITPVDRSFQVTDSRGEGGNLPVAIHPDLALERSLDRAFGGSDAPALQHPGGEPGEIWFRSARDVLDYLAMELGRRARTAALALVGYRQIRFIRPRGLPGHAFDGIVDGATSEITPAGDTRVDSPFGGGRKLTTEGEDEVHVDDPVGALRRLLQSGRQFEVEWQDGVINVVDGYADQFHIRLDPNKSITGSVRDHGVEITTSIGATSMSPAFRGLVRDLAAIDPSLRFRSTDRPQRLPADQFLAQFTPPDAALGKGALVLWHGTTTRFYYQAESGELDPTLVAGGIRPIQRFGLQPPNATGAVNWIGPEGSPHAESYASMVYLATDQKHAEIYALRATKVYGGRAIVLQVTVPDPAKLVADDDYLMSMDEAGAANPTALESLKRYGQVAYVGRIPSSFIRVAWEADQSFNPRPGAAERVPLFRELYVLQGATTGAIAGVMDLYRSMFDHGYLRGLLHDNAVDHSGMWPWKDFGTALDHLLYPLGWIGSSKGVPNRVVGAVDQVREDVAASQEMLRALDPFVRDLEAILEDQAPQAEVGAWLPGKDRVEWLFKALDRIDLHRLSDEEGDRIDGRIDELAAAGTIDYDWRYNSKRHDAFNAASAWWNERDRIIDELRAVVGAEVWDEATVQTVMRKVDAWKRLVSIKQRFDEALPRAEADMANVERRLAKYERSAARRTLVRRAGVIQSPPAMVRAMATWARDELARTVANPYGSSGMATFPVDLTGWRYASDPEAARRQLAAAGITSVMVQILPTVVQGVDHRGMWTGSAIQVFPDLNAIAQDPRLLGPWQDELAIIINHELAHAAQDWMKVLGMGDAPGGPPNPDQAKSDLLKDNPVWHPLRDEEFQPNLQSWVEKISAELSRTFPVNLRRKRLYHILTDDDRYRGLRILRKNEPERWQRAVREIAKAVSERVEIPGLKVPKGDPQDGAAPTRVAMAAPIDRADADAWGAGSALPEPYFHATRDPDFDELDSQPADYQHGGSIGAGIYVTPDREYALEYYGDHVFEVRLRVRNPFSMDGAMSFVTRDEEHERIWGAVFEDGSGFLEWAKYELDALGESDPAYAEMDDATFEAAALHRIEVELANGARGDSMTQPVLDLLERYVDRELEAMEIPDSILVGESIPPFYLTIGDTTYSVGFKRPDDPAILEIDLDDIGNEAAAAGFDAVVWEHRVPGPEVLVFDPDHVAIVSDTLAPERRTAAAEDVTIEPFPPDSYEATLGLGYAFYRVTSWDAVDEWCDDLGVGRLPHVGRRAMILHDLDMHGSAGQGQGRVLFERILAHAKSLGAAAVVLESVPESVGFWERMGFETVAPAGKNTLMRRTAAWRVIALDGVTTRVEITDSHRGELYGSVLAEDPQGRRLGYLDFGVSEDTVYEVVGYDGQVVLETTDGIEADRMSWDHLEGYDDDPPPYQIRHRDRKLVHVKMIEVAPDMRRRGIGRILVDALKAGFPDAEIETGMKTGDGGAFFGALDAAVDPKVLYHGTTSALLPEIEEAGYLRMPYLTSSYEIAAYYAESVAEELGFGGHPVVIEVPFDVLDPDLLRADRRSYDEPLWQVKQRHGIQSDDEWAEALENGRLANPSSWRDWQTSLEVVDAIDYQGTVPFRYLKITRPNEVTAAGEAPVVTDEQATLGDGYVTFSFTTAGEVDESYRRNIDEIAFNETGDEEGVSTGEERVTDGGPEDLVLWIDHMDMGTDRGRGLGRRLLDATLDYAARKGAVAVYLQATRDSHNFWSHMGFREFEDDGYVYWMGRDLTDRVKMTAARDERWLYHGTTSERVPAIQARGLLPSTNPNPTWTPRLREHSRDRVFFARDPWEALKFADMHVDLRGDSPLAVPVVLRVPWGIVYAGVGDTDNPDTFARGSVRTGEAIPPEYIEMSVRGRWTPIRDVAPDEIPWVTTRPDGWLVDQRGRPIATQDRNISTRNLLWDLGMRSLPESRPDDWSPQPPIKGPINAQRDERRDPSSKTAARDGDRPPGILVNIQPDPDFLHPIDPEFFPRAARNEAESGDTQSNLYELPAGTTLYHGTSWPTEIGEDPPMWFGRKRETAEFYMQNDNGGDPRVIEYQTRRPLLLMEIDLGDGDHNDAVGALLGVDEPQEWSMADLATEFCSRHPGVDGWIVLDGEGEEVMLCDTAALRRVMTAARDEGGEMSRDESGELRWGRRAAGLLIVRGDGRVLLTLRSADVMDPGVWGIPGGRVEPGESEWSGAVHEATEELGSLPPVRKLTEHVYRSGGFTYTTFIVEMDEAAAEGFEAELNWENDDWGWFPANEPPMPLHPGVAAVLPGVTRTAPIQATADSDAVVHPEWPMHFSRIENLDSILSLGLLGKWSDRPSGSGLLASIPGLVYFVDPQHDNRMEARADDIGGDVPVGIEVKVYAEEMLPDEDYFTDEVVVSEQARDAGLDEDEVLKWVEIAKDHRRSPDERKGALERLAEMGFDGDASYNDGTAAWDGDIPAYAIFRIYIPQGARVDVDGWRPVGSASFANREWTAYERASGPVVARLVEPGDPLDRSSAGACARTAADDAHPHAPRYVVDEDLVARELERYRSRDIQEDIHLFETAGEWAEKCYEVVPLDAIRIDPVWKPERYERARQAIENGIPIPPVHLSETRPGAPLAIDDGIHRCNAARDAGITEIPAFVYRIRRTPPVAQDVRAALADRRPRRIAQSFVPPPAMVSSATDMAIHDYIQQVANGASATLARQDIDDDDRANIQEILDESNARLELAPEAVRQPDIRARNIPVDLTGWRYVREEARAAAESLLVPGPTLTVRVWRDGKERSAGGYHHRRFDIWLDLPFPSTTGHMTGIIDRIRGVVEHELTHWSQDALAIINGRPGRVYGLPGRTVRDRSVDPHGYPSPPDPTVERADHPLRDVEFWPLINNAVDDFRDSLRSIPPRQWRHALRDVFYGDETWVSGRRNPFIVWRERDPERWRRGVTAFLKRLEETVPPLWWDSLRVRPRRMPAAA